MSSSPESATTNVEVEGRRRRDGDSNGTTDATPNLATLTIRTPGQLAARVPQRTPITQIARPGASPTSSGGTPRTANGLSASARRLRATSVTNTATPHARRAIEVFKGRRTAIFNTPGGRHKTMGSTKRRASQGGPDPQKDGPFDALRHLSRRLAPLSQPVVTSSSPGAVSSIVGGAESARRARDLSGIFIDEDDEDDVSGFIERRPRLSLPIDAGDDDEADLRPPRTSGLENIADDTAISIEAPRRAISEQPYRRVGRDRDSLRMSDYFANGQDDFTVEVGQDFDSPIPPAFDTADGDTVRPDDDTYERLDSLIGRQEAMAAGRQSDFGIIEVPLGVDSPFRLEPVLQDSSDPAPLPPPDFEHYDYNSTASEMTRDAKVDHYENNFSAAASAAGPGFGMDGEVDDFENIEDETEMVDPRGDDQMATKLQLSNGKRKPGLKISKYGLPCPSLPPLVVKRLAETIAGTSGIGNAKITPETLQVLMQATDWFFEQMGDDLRALAHHAGRKTIDQSDVVTLMKRQRQIDSQTTLFSLAQRHLPRELLQELRMPARAPQKKRRKAAVRATSFET